MPMQRGKLAFIACNNGFFKREDVGSLVYCIISHQIFINVISISVVIYNGSCQHEIQCIYSRIIEKNPLFLATSPYEKNILWSCGSVGGRGGTGRPGIRFGAGGIQGLAHQGLPYGSVLYQPSHPHTPAHSRESDIDRQRGRGKKERDQENQIQIDSERREKER